MWQLAAEYIEGKKLRRRRSNAKNIIAQLAPFGVSNANIQGSNPFSSQLYLSKINKKGRFKREDETGWRDGTDQNIRKAGK